ncbi:AraC family transcriptional regulator [Treponema peruense]|uniref:AraC family transcriptional regulator n=1 Tax=Treponema peruense TaxID=2787628 RepID=A0A7T3V562_9SPIR|nr:AraC family transcriptional regulator [Treponema peruense]QQA00640.1 AraC family transcriptional regulator [Treponema peruense]
MDDKKKLFYREFVNRENDFVRAPLVPETEFFSAIKTGNVKKVKELCREPLDEKNGLGVLSTNPLRNLKYHFVITAAMIARSCIEGGMEFSRAYSMSDVYIMEADIMTDVKEISSLHKKMCLEYTSEMKRISQKRIYSKYVNACLNFIYENLHDKITAKKLAEVSGLSESYILRLFHKETGKTVQEYVLEKKN